MVSSSPLGTHGGSRRGPNGIFIVLSRGAAPTSWGTAPWAFPGRKRRGSEAWLRPQRAPQRPVPPYTLKASLINFSIWRGQPCQGHVSPHLKWPTIPGSLISATQCLHVCNACNSACLQFCMPACTRPHIRPVLYIFFFFVLHWIQQGYKKCATRENNKSLLKEANLCAQKAGRFR